MTTRATTAKALRYTGSFVLLAVSFFVSFAGTLVGAGFPHGNEDVRGYAMATAGLAFALAGYALIRSLNGEVIFRIVVFLISGLGSIHLFYGLLVLILNYIPGIAHEEFGTSHRIVLASRMAFGLVCLVLLIALAPWRRRHLGPPRP